MASGLRYSFAGVMVVVACTAAACGGGGSKMEGTYTSALGNVTLDLRSGGKARLTLMGESAADCTYTTTASALTLDCPPPGGKVDFVIHDDGSLDGPGYIGAMKKSK